MPTPQPRTPQERSEPRRLEFGPTRALQASHRLTKKSLILRRLLEGPARTEELSQITPAYSQRMGDLKREGYRISREDFVDETGEWSVYALEPEERSLTWGRY